MYQLCIMWSDTEAAKYGAKYVSLASGCRVNGYITKKLHAD